MFRAGLVGLDEARFFRPTIGGDGPHDGVFPDLDGVDHARVGFDRIEKPCRCPQSSMAAILDIPGRGGIECVSQLGADLRKSGEQGTGFRGRGLGNVDLADGDHGGDVSVVVAGQGTGGMGAG